MPPRSVPGASGLAGRLTGANAAARSSLGRRRIALSPVPLLCLHLHRGLEAVGIHAQCAVEFSDLPIGAFSNEAIVADHSRGQSLHSFAWIGQPYARSITTITINAFGLRKPSNIVPACAASRLPTGLAAITRTCLPMAYDSALPNLPSCHAGHIRAITCEASICSVVVFIFTDYRSMLFHPIL